MREHYCEYACGSGRGAVRLMRPGNEASTCKSITASTCKSIKDEHAARSPEARHEARFFGPARPPSGPCQARHGPQAVLGLSPRPAGRHGTARFQRGGPVAAR